MTCAKRPLSDVSSGDSGRTITHSTSSDRVIGSPISPSTTSSSVMKKFKSQPPAAAAEREKNGLHPHSAHLDPTAAAAAQPTEEEDPMLVDLEDLKTGASTAITSIGASASSIPFIDQASSMHAWPKQPNTTGTATSTTAAGMAAQGTERDHVII